MVKFDKKTKSILFALDKNSRQSNSQLAKAVGLSKDTINYRIRKLELQGIIQQYTAIINTKKLGFQSVRVNLTLRSASPKQQQNIIKFLVSENNIFLVSQYTSSTDIVFGFASKDNLALQKFVDKLKKNHSAIIDEIEFAFYDSLHHLHRNYLTGNTVEKTNFIFDDEYIAHDELDINILKELTTNARIPITNLAKKLKKPITTIISRIKNLEKKKIILGYSVVLSTEKLSLDYYKIELKLDNLTEQAGILEFCKQQPEIIYYMKTTGNWDLELFTEIESSTKLQNIIQSIQNKFLIRKIKYRSAIKYHKFKYF